MLEIYRLDQGYPTLLEFVSVHSFPITHTQTRTDRQDWQQIDRKWQRTDRRWHAQSRRNCLWKQDCAVCLFGHRACWTLTRPAVETSATYRQITAISDSSGSSCCFSPQNPETLIWEKLLQSAPVLSKRSGQICHLPQVWMWLEASGKPRHSAESDFSLAVCSRHSPNVFVPGTDVSFIMPYGVGLVI